MKSTYTENYKKLLVRMVAARKLANMTQENVSKLLDRPQSYISKIENGERRIDLIEFLEISKILGVDPCEVINDLI